MKVIICGANGHMGRELITAIQAKNELEIVAAVDTVLPGGDYECKTSLSDVNTKADMLIDFSHHSATGAILEFCIKNRMPAVIATTGQTELENFAIAEASKLIPIFKSGNMSVGIALLVSMAKQAAAAFPDADIEIVEVHHNRKIDVPSGTALMIANGIKEARENSSNFVIGRHENGKRQPGDIGIHSLRLGNVVGEHEVRINTGNQSLILKHEAHSRALFADGAIEAAKYLSDKSAGLYSLDDMFK